jgi:hypothetical protein
MMKVEIGRSGNNRGATHKIGVDSWAKASAIVRAYIDDFNLGAGYGSTLEAFTGGKVFDGDKQIGRISYNGRAWDMNDQPMVQQ